MWETITWMKGIVFLGNLKEYFDNLNPKKHDIPNPIKENLWERPKYPR